MGPNKATIPLPCLDTKREPQMEPRDSGLDLNAVYIGSTQYYSFLIDIN
jgi:hypothetical protein